MAAKKQTLKVVYMRQKISFYFLYFWPFTCKNEWKKVGLRKFA